MRKKIEKDIIKVASASDAQELWNRDKQAFELWALEMLGAKPRPFEGGTIGFLPFTESGRKRGNIIVQVKGARSLTTSMVRDLANIVDRLGAAMGLLISLGGPTLSVISESVHAGSYESELWRRKFLKVQIRSVAELLEGKSFDIPQPYSQLKKHPRRKSAAETGRLL